MRIKVGGKFGFSNLSNKDKEKIKEKLSKKIGIESGTGVKIDGKEVTKENVHEFEITPSRKKPKEKKKKYTKSGLEKLEFSELKEIAKEFGETGRSKKGLIKDILNHL